MAKPKRGEVWLVDMGYVAKVRPALVLSIPVEGDERAITTVVPHTTSVRGTKFEVQSNVRWLKPGAFDVQGIGTYPTVKLIQKLGDLPPDQISSIETCVRTLLGLVRQRIPATSNRFATYEYRRVVIEWNAGGTADSVIATRFGLAVW